MKIAIVTDSIANITENDLKKYPIYMGYLNVIVNGKTYIDQLEINNETLFELIDKGATYSTSQPSPEVFVKLYEQLLKEYDHILSLHMTHKGSGTVNSARIASTMVEGGEEKISVIDTLTAAIGEENIIIKAAQLIQAGKSLDEILAAINYYIHHNGLCISIDDLNTLVVTGRLSKAAATIGNLLHIKPIIGFDPDYNLTVLEKFRTRKRVIKYIVERIQADVETSGKQIVRITHVNALDMAQEVKAIIEANCGDVEVYIGNEIGPVMAVHFGRGGFGVNWLADQYQI